MGTINYKTGNVITLGLNTDYDDQDEFNEHTIETFNKAKEIINNHSFVWFKLIPEYGYYEGASVIVNKDYYTINEIKREKLPLFMQLKKEDIDDIKVELAELKEVILELSEFMPVCYPGWCTGYEMTKEGIAKAVDKAVENVLDELKEDIKNVA